MAPRTTPPFRADHVGSLLRPPDLLRARADHAAGTITAAQLQAAEDEAVRAAVRVQEEIGLRSATDGEFRRAEWHTDFIKRLGGIREGAAGTPVPVLGGDQSAPTRPTAPTSPARYTCPRPSSATTSASSPPR